MVLPVTVLEDVLSHPAFFTESNLQLASKRALISGMDERIHPMKIERIEGIGEHQSFGFGPVSVMPAVFFTNQDAELGMATVPINAMDAAIANVSITFLEDDCE